MINQINQQSKPNPKGKAVISLVLGIISVINGIGVIYGPIIINGFNQSFPSIIIKYIYAYGNPINFSIATSLISIIGIILGKTGLKSTKKGIAIAGIVLCIVGLLGALFFCFFIKMMESTF